MVLFYQAQAAHDALFSRHNSRNAIFHIHCLRCKVKLFQGPYPAKRLREAKAVLRDKNNQ